VILRERLEKASLQTGRARIVANKFLRHRQSWRAVGGNLFDLPGSFFGGWGNFPVHSGNCRNGSDNFFKASDKWCDRPNNWPNLSDN